MKKLKNLLKKESIIGTLVGLAIGITAPQYLPIYTATSTVIEKAETDSEPVKVIEVEEVKPEIKDDQAIDSSTDSEPTNK